MLIPTPNTTCFWSDRGEVRLVTRSGGMCDAVSDDRVPVTWTVGKDLHGADVRVNDLHLTELDALRAASFWLTAKSLEITTRIMELTK